MTPCFAIIITSFERPTKIIRAVKSVTAQTYLPVTTILINDSPEFDYHEVEKFVQDVPHLTYIRNSENRGKNYSVTFALNTLQAQKFEGYVVFLDDDDWLDPACLARFAQEIQRYPLQQWFVSNRVRSDGKNLTENNTGKTMINYVRDCLVTHRFSGDATHCIALQAIGDTRFISTIKNGEEWFFFSHVAAHTPNFTYLDVAGTYTEGYASDGLTAKRLSFRQKINRYAKIRKTLTEEKSWTYAISIYMLLRFVTLLIYRKK